MTTECLTVSELNSPPNLLENPAPPISKKNYFGNIEGARGIAAFMVFFSHLHIPLGSFFNEYVDLGKAGVVLFFFVSGFLVLPSFTSHYQTKKFVISRFFRLYPVYWISIVLTLLLVNEPFTSLQVAGNSTMFQQFLGIPNMQSVYWTLTIELIFYIAIIVCSKIDHRYLDEHIIRSFHILGIFSITLGICRYLAHTKLPLALSLALLIMALGSIIRKCQSEGNYKLLKQLLVYFFAYVTISCYFGYSFKTRFDENATRYIVAYLIGTTFFLAVVFRGALFDVFILNFLGKLSYGFYVFHLPILIWSQSYFTSQPAVVLITLVVTICLSTATFYLVEKPAIKIGKKLNALTEK